MKGAATVVLLADRRQSRSAKVLKDAGYRLITSYTPDHAVAICVSKNVQAVVLDQTHFIVTEGWSVAQSLKMVRGKICVVLVVRGQRVPNELPEGVDATVPEMDPSALIDALHKLLDS